MAFYDFEELSNFTKAYGKSFLDNTNFTEDYERTKYFHYLENINKMNSESDEALDNYFSSLENSSLEHEEENDD